MNISKESETTVNTGIKTMAALSDVVIFLFLGIEVVGDHAFHWQFTIWTVILCVVIRFISIFGLCAWLNRSRIKPISVAEQFIMSYGGLRGAVGFSLVIILKSPFKKMFETTTMVMVFITCFIMGSTVKPLVNVFQITKRDKNKEKDPLLSEDVNEKCIDLVMAGLESVVGKKGKYRVIERIEKFDEKYVKPLLSIEGAEDYLALRLQEISMEQHYARLYAPAMMVADLQSDQTAKEPSAQDTQCDRAVLKEGLNANVFDRYNRVRFMGDGVSFAKVDEVKELSRKRTRELWIAAMRKVTAKASEPIKEKEGDAKEGPVDPGERSTPPTNSSDQ